MNLGVQISTYILLLFLLDIYPKVRSLDHVVVLFLTFWGTCILFPTVATLVYIPINSAQEFPFVTSLPTLVISCFFDDSRSDRCEVISHCAFDFHFPDDIEHLFMVCWPSIYLFWKNIYLDILPIFFNWVAFFLLLYELIYFEY